MRFEETRATAQLHMRQAQQFSTWFSLSDISFLSRFKHRGTSHCGANPYHPNVVNYTEICYHKSRAVGAAAILVWSLG